MMQSDDLAVWVSGERRLADWMSNRSALCLCARLWPAVVVVRSSPLVTRGAQHRHSTGTAQSSAAKEWRVALGVAATDQGSAVGERMDEQRADAERARETEKRANHNF